jgi:hypothetical protein
MVATVGTDGQVKSSWDEPPLPGDGPSSAPARHTPCCLTGHWAPGTMPVFVPPASGFAKATKQPGVLPSHRRSAWSLGRTALPGDSNKAMNPLVVAARRPRVMASVVPLSDLCAI